MLINKYPGMCYSCSEDVEKGEGYAFQWKKIYDAQKEIGETVWSVLCKKEECKEKFQRRIVAEGLLR